ncbi:MAG: NAD-dependent epimerase/dehydratase family protein [Planctomycetes bacterium]|nr:NAD-dependent epimerase/dehydratase family protein [Planctomycetota bacterium]
MRLDATVRQPLLVTGASGFIGGRLVRRLIELHGRVFCLVRGHSRTDELRSAGVQLITGDVTDRSSLDRALAQSQAGTVFHLAGLVRALRRDEFMRVNEGGAETVASACAGRADPPVLVVVSSLSAAGPSDTGRERVEGDAPTPVSNYGRSKLAGERTAAKYAGALPITVVRPTIVFGPADRGMLEIFRPIARWGLHLVPGREERRYSLVHVDDLVEALLLAAEKGERLLPGGEPGQGMYFIAGDEQVTYAQLGQAIADALVRKSPAILHLPAPLVKLSGAIGDLTAILTRRPGWVGGDKIADVLAGSWTCSSAKAHTQLGWFPTATLAERLRETAEWYRQAGWL